MTLAHEAVPPFVLATLALDEGGLICDCSRAAERLFGYRRDDLLERHVSILLPGLLETNLTQGEHVNPSLAYLSRCVLFKAYPRDGEGFACEVSFNRLGNPERPPLLVIIQRADNPTLPCL